VLTRDGVRVLASLSRVAFERGSMVVNSARGGAPRTPGSRA